MRLLSRVHLFAAPGPAACHASLPFTFCIDRIWFTHSSIPGDSGCFHFVAVVNGAAVSVDG